MAGELQGDRVYVRDQSEANRIYNKGGYGKPLSGGALELDLVEAAYLVAAGRLTMTKPVESLGDLLRECARIRPSFGVQYLSYRELREQRGDLRLAPAPLRADGIDFRSGKDPRGAPIMVRASSERTPIALAELEAFSQRAAKDGAEAWFAVVDEESEVTQYRIAMSEPHATREPRDEKGTADGILLRDRLFLPTSGTTDAFHDAEFFGKKAPGGYYLSLVEGIHLAGAGRLRVTDTDGKRLRPEELRKAAREVEPGLELRHPVYEDLKSRGLIVKTGYKFGTHFRAYDDDPRSTHAPYLVEAVAPGASFEWPQLSRAIRLSHGVRKRLVLGWMVGKKARYLSIERLR